jgi:predicted 3-demethylubiquinone-9 3-methyltransferase (glyoxalase superfamily)
MKIESKEKLAKLLAVEDLDVQHQQVETAYFDVKNRCLILPIWKEMPDHLYDLLVGHEVGHALFTPTKLERLQKAYKKTSKSCVNIIEDARIEKLVKNRYPGLRKRFFSGYKHLVEKDFFGLSKRPISELNILDKINLYFKIPNAVDITFNKIEQSFVDRIEASKSFKDVEAIAKELYAYAKDNKKDDEQMGDEDENSQPQYSDEQSDGDAQDSEETEADDNDSGEDEDDDIEPDETEKAEGEGEESPVDEDQKALDDYMNNAPDDEKIEEQEIPEPKQSEHAHDEVRSSTFEHFQERMEGLVDSETNNYYLTIPDKANLKDAIVDYKVVHKMIDDFYGSMETNPNYWNSGWDDEKFNISWPIHPPILSDKDRDGG